MAADYRRQQSDSTVSIRTAARCQLLQGVFKVIQSRGRFSLRHLTLGMLITSIVEYLESAKDDIEVIRFIIIIIIMNDATGVTRSLHCLTAWIERVANLLMKVEKKMAHLWTENDVLPASLCSATRD